MKKLKFIFLLIILVALVGCKPQPEAKTQVTFTTLNNKQITLNSLKGKWVVINYWASWCKPCYKEIPALNAFAEKFKNKVLVFGVSYDHVQAEQLPAIIEKMNIQFPTLKYDPSQALGIDHIPGLPVTLVINPQGKLVNKLFGEQTEKSLAKAIT